MSPVVRFSNFGLGLVLNGAFRVGYTPEAMRRNFEWIGGLSALGLKARFPGLRFESDFIGGVPCEILTPKAGFSKTLIYLHGGGYFMGSPKAYRAYLARIASAAGIRVVGVDYRLAPEHPHPAPIDDTIAVYEEIKKTSGTEDIILGGDSAGGGLTLSVLMALRDRKHSLPAKAVCVSPWTDRTGSGISIDANAKADVWISRRHLEAWAPWSLAGQDAKDPLISPLFGDFRGLPPLMIFIGDQETLLDDALGAAGKAKAAGVDVELVVGRDMQHDWFYSLPWLAESRTAFEKLTRFLRDG